MASYTFTLEAIPLGAGEISFDGVNYQSYINSVVETITDRTLYARAKAGYRFKRFYIDGIGNRTDNPYHYGYQDTGFVSAYAEFEEDPSPTTYTVTLVAHNGWGQVGFADETPTTGTVSKTVPAGTSVTIKAIRTGYQEYVFWRTPSGDSYGDRVRTITPTADVTYTAFFGYLCHGHAAELSDPETALPVGEVQIVYSGGSTAWNWDMFLYVFEGSTVTFNQQASLAGWSFVKWRYRQGTSDWTEYTHPSIPNHSLSGGGLYAIALFQRTPTHLLVNSFNRSSPVQLVYYPATNKLVADY